ncbi:Enkurin [Reticulomyxa filosa]|uniref:Enkurin n=1 Tax=Reticulomyxa filosa TaxID=46433 RepID=X6N6F4_RETFI|nr:Enkurin [Reticulomyxa filosa]|eukprot:ETO21508.1 Enkurin [Reticulomyxa filosa]
MKVECIYNLIPPEEATVQKPPRYHSKHDGNLPPTASTFGTTITTTVAVANMDGDPNWKPVRSHKQSHSNFGPKTCSNKPRPDMFLKKKPKPELLQRDEKISATRQKIKPPVPKRNEIPVLGLQSNKDFIVVNALENILSSKHFLNLPKQKTQLFWGKNNIEPSQVESNKTQTENCKHSEFGKVPKYLEKIKVQAEDESKKFDELIKTKEQQKMAMSEIQLLSEAERVKILENLQKRFKEVNREFQQTTHLTQLDTLTKVRRKENYERELAQLQKDIEKMSMKHVYVRQLR